MKLQLKKASIIDCQEILDMQIRSFADLLHKYHDFKTNPGAATLEQIEQRMNQSFTDYYFIQLADKNICVIRIAQNKENTCRISPIFILPEYQGKGYAQQTILQVESLYLTIKNWELDTIKQEQKLCHLYEKTGYKPIGKEEEIQDGMTIIYYSK